MIWQLFKKPKQPVPITRAGLLMDLAQTDEEALGHLRAQPEFAGLTEEQLAQSLAQIRQIARWYLAEPVLRVPAMVPIAYHLGEDPGALLAITPDDKIAEILRERAKIYRGLTAAEMSDLISRIRQALGAPQVLQ